MTTLTNGIKTLTPDLVEFHPLCPRRSDDPLQLESQLLFGPTRERLRAGAGLLWWGSFSLAEQVGLTVYARRGARIRIEILDLEYRVIAEAVHEAGTLRTHAAVRQSGLVFFRAVNEGTRDELVILQAAARRAAQADGRSTEKTRLRRWLRSVRRWTGFGEPAPGVPTSG